MAMSIHVPRAGDDYFRFPDSHKTSIFQSTSPVRGTTVKHGRRIGKTAISIHVPRAGDDFVHFYPFQ